MSAFQRKSPFFLSEQRQNPNDDYLDDEHVLDDEIVSDIFDTAHDLMLDGGHPLELWQWAINSGYARDGVPILIDDFDMGGLFIPREWKDSHVSDVVLGPDNIEFLLYRAPALKTLSLDVLSPENLLDFCHKYGIHPADIPPTHEGEYCLENTEAAPHSVFQACITILQNQSFYSEADIELATDMIQDEHRLFHHQIDHDADFMTVSHNYAAWERAVTEMASAKIEERPDLEISEIPEEYLSKTVPVYGPEEVLDALLTFNRDIIAKTHMADKIKGFETACVSQLQSAERFFKALFKNEDRLLVTLPHVVKWLKESGAYQPLTPAITGDVIDRFIGEMVRFGDLKGFVSTFNSVTYGGVWYQGTRNLAHGFLLSVLAHERYSGNIKVLKEVDARNSYTIKVVSDAFEIYSPETSGAPNKNWKLFCNMLALRDRLNVQILDKPDGVNIMGKLLLRLPAPSNTKSNPEPL